MNKLKYSAGLPIQYHRNLRFLMNYGGEKTNRKYKPKHAFDIYFNNSYCFINKIKAQSSSRNIADFSREKKIK